ncbi:Alpha/beta knot methyltransferase [Cladochytrium replicatum]|nr:Alpha/beta knot methyltransferase [Cladochytrium replicatum]
MAKNRTSVGYRLGKAHQRAFRVRDLLLFGSVRALDRIQDPHNLGAILRNAHFFGVDGVIVTERESSPLSPTVSRASAGAMEAMDMYVTTNLSKLMERSDGWHVVGTAIPDLNSRTPASPIHSVKTRGPTIVVFGNEGEGLKPAVLRSCNELVWIPSGRARAVEAGVGMLDSLNVSVACGIVLSKLRGNEFLHGAGR